MKNLDNTIVNFLLVAFEKLENLIQMIYVRDKLLHLVDYDLNILFARLQNYPPPHLKLDKMKREHIKYDEDFQKQIANQKLIYTELSSFFLYKRC